MKGMTFHVRAWLNLRWFWWFVNSRCVTGNTNTGVITSKCKQLYVVLQMKNFNFCPMFEMWRVWCSVLSLPELGAWTLRKGTVFSPLLCCNYQIGKKNSSIISPFHQNGPMNTKPMFQKIISKRLCFAIGKYFIWLPGGTQIHSSSALQNFAHTIKEFIKFIHLRRPSGAAEEVWCWKITMSSLTGPVFRYVGAFEINCSTS